MNINRRQFIMGASALSIAGWREIAEAAGYPSYYGEHLARVADRVSELTKTCVGGCWFITDPHVRSNHCQSGMLLAELVKRTSLNRVVCGGDLVEAFGKGYSTDRAAIDFATDRYRDLWVKPIREAGGKIYTARGNHDFTVCHGFDTPEERKHGWTYGGKYAHDLIVNQFSEKGIVTNPADPESCYFYFDDHASKLRYVIADTTDSQREGDFPWSVHYGVHDQQLAWLAGEAFAKLPADFNLVVVHHIPVTGVVGNANDKKFMPLLNLLEQFQNRGRYSVGKNTFDFSSATGKILISLTGHEHCEMSTFQKGVLHVTNPCDACYRDYIDRSRPWCDFPEKKKGTIFEQTFDAVQFDPIRKLVHFTRVGGGYDRAYHLEAKTVKVGASIQLSAPLLNGVVKWGAYDADRITNLPDPKNRYGRLAKYHNDFGSIAADGTFAASQKGEVIALAMDKKLNKEIFPLLLTP